MTKENNKRFFDRFDFIRTSGDISKDAMVWGFECEDGWFDLLWELCENLEETESGNTDFIVTQVKEKFGCLRFYTSEVSEEGESLINRAELKSEKTCEMCGEPGTIQPSKSGWITCLCEEHSK